MHGTCFPLPSFDINNHSPVLLSKVLQDDHIMGFIGIIHINTAGSHTEDLEHGRQRQKGDMETRKNSCQTWRQERILRHKPSPL